MDIRRLSHFIALAEEGRFAAAAQRVHLSQAAFSRSIQTLEQRLGLQLVDRASDGARLTAAGAVVLERARALVFDSGCLERDVALMRSGEAGELVIGVAPIPAATVVPALLARLQRERPQVAVRLHFGNLPQLLQQLEAQQLDFCLGDPRLVAASERLATAEVARTRAALHCRAGHPAARRRGEPGPALLTQYGLGTISITPELLAPLARALGFAAPADFPVRVQCDDIAMLQQLARETDLIVIAPEPAGTALPPGLHQLRGPEPRPRFANLHALWLQGRTLSPAARFAIDAARELGRAYR
ncbi:LysR family transcriptional regulator [Paucibacter sp. R3-3]|uniref:LysR family transcriptional regulator n=1 Tax=Roseateles agri TaxID=3098619 RepID=A0ABU5DF67_9BURK|nr:LysR family transcriptional regulator [Paucibacter sp. R3-3]MDY0744928.1 LysR family transcriptional regulator [Paucibacter sp. R3-3]